MFRLIALPIAFLLCHSTGVFAQPQPVSFAQSPQFAVPITGSLSTADFNADGNPDLLVTSAAPPGIVAYMGNGHGEFQPVVTPLQELPHGVIVGNFNGDRYPDVAVCHEGSVEILLGKGDGTFVSTSSITLPYPSDESCRYMTSADVNQDGNADLVIPSSSSILVYLGDGTGQFTQKSATLMPGAVPGPVLSGVFHSGKSPDIVAASGLPVYGPLFQMYLLAGDGDGTFQPPVAISHDFFLSCAAGDYNNDGRLDLACAGQQQTGYAVYLGNGDGTFQKPQAHEAADDILSLQTADLDGDGNPDLIFEFGSWCYVPCTPTGADTMAVSFGKGDGTFGPVTYLPVGTQAVTAVAADFNSDGEMDLAILEKTSNADPDLSAVTLLFGKGNRRFESPDTYYQRGSFHIAAADFNGDGNLDLIAFDDYINTPYGIYMLPGRGDGTFGKAIFTSTTSGLEFGGVADFNGDGKMDVWAEDTNGNLDILLGNGSGGFRQVSSLDITPSSLLVADVNNDGIPDLIVETSPPEFATVEILLGKGDGTFQAPIPVCTSCTLGCTGDFNGDGNEDLIVFSSSGGAVYFGNGDGTFQAGPALPPGYIAPITAADLNGDGTLDLVIVGPTSILLGNGDGTFRPGQSQPALDVAAGQFLVSDLNGDGIPDVAVVSNSQVTFFLGTGDANFVQQARIVPFSVVYSDPSVLLGNFNNDGKPDLGIFDQVIHVAYVLLNSTP